MLPRHRTKLLHCAEAQAQRIRRPASRATALLRVVEAYADAEERTYIDPLIHEIEAICARSKNPDQGFISVKLAVWFAKNGNLSKANELFLKVTSLLKEDTDVVQTAGMLTVLTQAYCDLGWFEMTTHLFEDLWSPLLDGIVADIYRDTILSAVARKYLEQGNLLLSANTIEKIGNGSTKASDSLELIIQAMKRQDVPDNVWAAIVHICHENESSN